MNGLPQQIKQRSSSIKPISNASSTKSTSGSRSLSLAGGTGSSNQKSPMSPQKPSFTQPTIDFQLSKKTAELTMIVQMLFTQLHTKEAECELWQRYYNEFGETILRELANERQQTAALRSALASQEAALVKAQEEAQRRVKEMDKLKVECAHAVERFQNIQNQFNDIVAEKTSLAVDVAQLKNQLGTQKEICANLQNDIVKADALVKGSEKALRQNQTRQEKEIAQLHTENKNLTTDFNHLKTYADDLVAMKEKAEEDKKSIAATLDVLRMDYMSLKEKYDAARAAPFVNPNTILKSDENERRAKLASARKNLRSAAVQAEEPNSMDAELQKLRTELQRYKMELKNRDASFNRMFVAATNRNSARKVDSNLVTTAEVQFDDDAEQDDTASMSSNMNSSRLQSKQLSLFTHNSSTATNGRRDSNQRVPLMPAQFSSSMQNSVKRAIGASSKPTTFPPV